MRYEPFTPQEHLLAEAIDLIKFLDSQINAPDLEDLSARDLLCAITGANCLNGPDRFHALLRPLRNAAAAAQLRELKAIPEKVAVMGRF